MLTQWCLVSLGLAEWARQTGSRRLYHPSLLPTTCSQHVQLAGKAFGLTYSLWNSHAVLEANNPHILQRNTTQRRLQHSQNRTSYLRCGTPQQPGPSCRWPTRTPLILVPQFLDPLLLSLQVWRETHRSVQFLAAAKSMERKDVGFFIKMMNSSKFIIPLPV